MTLAFGYQIPSPVGNVGPRDDLTAGKHAYSIEISPQRCLPDILSDRLADHESETP